MSTEEKKQQSELFDAKNKKRERTLSQQASIDSVKDQVIVTASAGAGKTSTMIDRVIKLVADGLPAAGKGGERKPLPITSVIMLTFTEAAAKEMREKLEVALLKEIRKEQASEHRDPEREKRLQDAHSLMPFLKCGTIDSFCFDLVKKHFELLDLPSSVSLADETRSDGYIKEAMRFTLEEFASASLDDPLADPDKYYRFLQSFGYNEEEQLAKEIKNLYQYAETMRDGDAFLEEAKNNASVAFESRAAVKTYVSEIKAKALTLLRSIRAFEFAPPPSGPKMRIRDQYYRIVNDLADLCKAPDFSAFFIAAKRLKKLDGILKEERVAYESAFAVWERIDDAYTSFLEELSHFKWNDMELSAVLSASDSADVLTILDLTKKFKAKYQEVKAREGVLDFADVEHYALKLLEMDGVAAEIGCRELLMDESQDLNRLQEAVMNALVEKGSLYIVGDVKQSIYRFRLADPELFQQRVREGKANPNADVISFDVNFRSSDAVIGYVNDVFSNLMTEEFGGVTYTKATRDKMQGVGSGQVRCFFYTKKAADAALVDHVYSVEEAAKTAEEQEGDLREAYWVRDRIKELIGVELADTAEVNQTFAVSYKDIAILSPVGQRGDSLQEKVINCLREAGIPVNVGGFVKDSENYEISALMDLLRLTISQKNDYALLSVLRSDLVGLSSDRLKEIASLYPGDFFYEKAEAAALSGDRDLCAFYEDLKRYRALSGTLSLYELVSLIVDERLRAKVPLRVGGRKTMGEILTFTEGLKTGNVTQSVPEYLDYFDHYFKKEYEGEIAEENAVNVMTVHKSKGLQFPIVFVIGLSRAPISTKEGENYVRMDPLFGVSKKGSDAVNDFEFNLFYKKKKKELREDALRLLYVAFTRAKNYLFVSGQVSGKNQLKEPKGMTDSQWEKASVQTRELKMRAAKKREKEFASSFAYLVLLGMDWKYVTDEDYVSEERTELDVTMPGASALKPPSAAGATGEEVAADLADNPSDDTPKKEVSPQTLLEQAFSYAYPHEEATHTGIKYTVTSINRREKQPDLVLPTTKFFPDEEAAERGTAYHRVMEKIDLDVNSRQEAELCLQRLVSAGEITEEEKGEIAPDKLLDAVKKVLLLAGERKDIRREENFLLHLSAREAGVCEIDDEVEVQGQIDFLAIGDRDAVIVDYKRSRHGDRALIDAYRGQLQLYATAVKKSFENVDRVHKYIFVLEENRIVELPD